MVRRGNEVFISSHREPIDCQLAQLRKEAHYFFKLAIMGDPSFLSDHTDEIVAWHWSKNSSTFWPRGKIMDFKSKAPIRASTLVSCCFSMSRAIHGSTIERLWMFDKAFE